MKKDIVIGLDLSKETKSNLNTLNDKVQNHEVILAEIKQWKKDKENENH